MASSVMMGPGTGPPPSMPPPNLNHSPYGQPNPHGVYGQPRYAMRPRLPSSAMFNNKTNPNGTTPSPANANSGAAISSSNDPDFDGKRPRKSMMRKTVDYNSAFMLMLERRISRRNGSFRERRALQPDITYYPDLEPPMSYLDNPANAVTTRFVKTATNKMRCPIFTLAWTPEGRRLITGASSGEFTLWNGLTFNFETILQAHDSAVRSMVWSNNDQWMVTGDHGGYIKYWQSNMNNVKMFQAHKEPVRSISFSPTDLKFSSCSDDGTVRVWDFFSCTEERVLRGHGSDVKCVDWHPTKGILASGSKDNQQPVKIWEPKTGAVLCTLHAHKSTVMDVKWNKNGNWLLTASRDHLLKLFDIRNTKQEVQTFRGHKKEASTLAWHPIHEGVFASGGSDGCVMFWNVGADKEVGAIEQAHESIVWSLAWHPVGHILCSGSNDHSCKFWTRNRPGDTMRDKYNLNTNPQEEDTSGVTGSGIGIGINDNSSSAPIIPGMAPEDRIEGPGNLANSISSSFPGDENSLPSSGIPGLDPDTIDPADKKKTPYAKPIPKNFQAKWSQSSGNPASAATNQNSSQPPQMMGPPLSRGGGPNNFAPSQENTYGNGQRSDQAISLTELQRLATAVVAMGNVYPVLPGSNLYMSILNGEQAVKDALRNEIFRNQL